MNVIIAISYFLVFIFTMVVVKLIVRVNALTNAIKEMNNLNKLIYKLNSVEMEIETIKKGMGGGGSPSPPTPRGG